MMKKTEQKKVFIKKAQTAIEYMLLLTICALIVFVSFKTFFEPSGRVRNGLDLYFNKVGNGIMGKAPALDATLPTIPPCSSFTAAGKDVCNFYSSRCTWLKDYDGPHCTGHAPSCVDRASAAGCVMQWDGVCCRASSGCECRCQAGCPCGISDNRDDCVSTADCVWYMEFYKTQGCDRGDKGPYCIKRSELDPGPDPTYGFSAGNCQETYGDPMTDCCYNNTSCNLPPGAGGFEFCLCTHYLNRQCDVFHPGP